MKICRNCLAWKEAREPRPADEPARGECRLKPPAALSEAFIDDETGELVLMPATSWPIVFEDDWCIDGWTVCEESPKVQNEGKELEG